MGGKSSKPKKPIKNMDIIEIREIKLEAQRELENITDERERAEYNTYISELSAQEAQLAERGAARAEGGAVTAEGRAVRAEEGAVTAEGRAITAQEGAVTAEGRAVTAKEGAVTAQEGAVTAQEGAVTAQEEAVTAQKQTKSILNDVEDDIGSGVITSEAINPIIQTSKLSGDKTNLENLKSTIKNITEPFMNFFNSKNNKEGFDVMDFFNAYINNEEQRIAMEEKELQHQINDIKKDQSLEFGALRDDIMGKILMNYMINEEGTNIEKVYNKLNQENNDALRKIQISNYYTKSYKEYINLLKIILIAIAIIIPILIFNKLEIINKDITLLSITLIILLTSLFCIYRIYLLYMKDPINFDKIKIPYDRQMRELDDQKKLKYKDSPFKSAGITCIGDECCDNDDNDMIYDNLRNKCINKRQETQESFHNYFENAMKINNSNKSIIEQNDIPESQKTFSYLGGNANIIKNSNHIKEGLTNRRNLLQQLASASLKNSSYDKF